MAEIIRELRFGSRVIVTDLPVKLDPWLRHFVSGVSWSSSPSPRSSRSSVQVESGLVAYLLKNFGSDFSVRQRLRILTEAEAKEFYLIRCRRSDNEWFTLEHKRDAKNGSVESFSTAVPTHPTVYITDECWRTFPSREWQTTGKGVIFYAAQHAKLGDDWYLTTQHTNQIEKQLRDLAQDFYVLKNLANRRLAMFRGPSVFTCSIYDRAPNGVMIEPMSVSTFRLDKKGIGACYDTAAGSGVVGQGADIGQAKKGLPFVLVICAVFVVLGLIILSPKLVSGALSAYMSKPAPPPVPASAPVATGPAPAGVFNIGKIAQNSIASDKAPAEPEPVKFVAYSNLNGVRSYVLSDGTSGVVRRAFQRLSSSEVLIDGKVYPVGSPDSEAARSSAVPFIQPQTFDYHEANPPSVTVTVIGKRQPVDRAPIAQVRQSSFP